MNLLVLFIVLYLKVFLISCQSCSTLLTCSKCIGYTHEKCVWCSAKDHDGRRCESRTAINSTWCKDLVYDPQDIQISEDLSLNKTFSDGSNNTGTIQFTPQYMKIKARTNVPIEINMSYRPAKDYPLDVYYLLDASGTMKSYQKKLFEQGLEIYAQLSNITNNVRLGVGSFVEKPGLPYVDVSVQTSYSFKHHQRLTNDTKKFTAALNELQSIDGNNNDEPEAGLDALMEAMVCKEKIGWRPYSHKIILLSTDSTYHSVGDGKFVGAIKPHDMKCHLDKDNVYSEALTFDYPSVSQINKVATENKIIIIFAADLKVKSDYTALEKKIKNAKYVPLMARTDVVKMILEEYETVVSDVQLETHIPSFMNLKFNPDCTVKGQCIYKLNKPVETVATLVINSCPTERKYDYKLNIGPVSIDEKLTLDVQVECQCDCEKDGERDSDKCSKSGTYQCGICECNKDRYGDICDCSGNFTSVNDLEKCKADPSDPKAQPCNGRGTCRCGKCIKCSEGYSGDFCEFNDNLCPRPGGQLCSGHGRCTYGKCLCDPHWLPDDCRCPDNNNACIAPDGEKPCSGRGECVCGKCLCSTSAPNEYCIGAYCDDCVKSTAERCHELEDYALCNLMENKTICDQHLNFTATHQQTEVYLENKTMIYSPIHYMAKMWCKKELEDGRILVFRYHYPKSSTSSIILVIQDEFDMPPVANVWVTVGSVIGAVLLIGLLTLFTWKFLVDQYDKREYAKFEKDSKAAGFVTDINPLYQDPATTFRNPAYKVDD